MAQRRGNSDNGSRGEKNFITLNIQDIRIMLKMKDHSIEMQHVCFSQTFYLAVVCVGLEDKIRKELR